MCQWELMNGNQELDMLLLSRESLIFYQDIQKMLFPLLRIFAGLGYKIEIGDLGSFVGGVAGYWLFQYAIDNLVKQGLVEGRKIKQSTGEQVYYKIL